MTKKKNQKDYQQFKVGDLIEWTSHAHGFNRTKIGIVIRVLPIGTTPDDFASQVELWKIHRPGGYRNHESYIIALPHPDKPTEFFWPRVGHLKKSKRYLPVILEKRKEKKGTFNPNIKEAYESFVSKR